MILTERQLEVMNLVKLGFSNKKIADRLYITLQTVKTHMHSILDMLRAKDRAHAVFICLKLGLIDFATEDKDEQL